jgi:hypothetical protein
LLAQSILKIFYQIYSDNNISKNYTSEYFGITQDPITKDIMPYYNLGDLIHYLSNDSYIILCTKASDLLIYVKGLKYT